MNEIEKLYNNAKVKPIDFAEKGAIDFIGTIEISGKRYPDFTAEKQLDLIKWLISEWSELTLWHFKNNKKPFSFDINDYSADEKTFEEALAKLFNNIWNDLTEEEQKVIKGTLDS